MLEAAGRHQGRNFWPGLLRLLILTTYCTGLASWRDRSAAMRGRGSSYAGVAYTREQRAYSTGSLWGRSRSRVSPVLAAA